jgi:uncharacterized membrane protein YfcA
MDTVLVLAAAILLVAILYSSIGQAGGSGYLALMAFAGLAPNEMKSAALALNVVVASIATLRFHRAGHITWSRVWPYAAGAVPLAALGGTLSLPGDLYYWLVGILLLLTAARTVQKAVSHASEAEHSELAGDRSQTKPELPPVAAAASGAGVGLLAGTAGIGGGILLAPLLQVLGRFDTRSAVGIVAAFNLLNSSAALTTNFATANHMPPGILLWTASALTGAWIGTHLGIRVLQEHHLQLLLGIVLLVAGVRLLTA